MPELKLQNISTMTDEELKVAADGCFDYATTLTPVRRLSILLEAGFYTDELHRREEEQAQNNRDSVETDRWRCRSEERKDHHLNDCHRNRSLFCRDRSRDIQR